MPIILLAEGDVPKFYFTISVFCALNVFNERISLFSLSELLCWKIYNLTKSFYPEGHFVFPDFRPETHFLCMLKSWQHFGYRKFRCFWFVYLLFFLITSSEKKNKGTYNNLQATCFLAHFFKVLRLVSLKRFLEITVP